MKEIVSVYVLTFNHVDYIRDALEGILMQKTSFPIKIFIYDDASTDGTSDIVKEYVSKYPQKISAYISPINTWNLPDRSIKRNSIARKYVLGDYVAFCEGDDYWTDPNKLQIQVDYMNAHPECSIVSHASKWMDYTNNTEYEYHPYSESRNLTEEEVFLQPGGNLTSASLLMKSEVWFKEESYPTADVGDVTTQWYALTKGKVHYMDRIMCTYRYCHNGSWSKDVGKDPHRYYIHAVKMLAFLEGYERYTLGKYHDLIIKKMKEYYDEGFENYYRYTEGMSCQIYNNTQFSETEKKYSDDIIRIYNAICGRFTLDITTLKNAKHLVIFGHGKLSKYVVKKLKEKGINWEGFVVSDGQKCQYDGEIKTVWQLKEYPFSFEDTVVVLGLDRKFRTEIEEALYKYNPRKVVAPFWENIRWSL